MKDNLFVPFSASYKQPLLCSGVILHKLPSNPLCSRSNGGEESTLLPTVITPPKKNWIFLWSLTSSSLASRVFASSFCRLLSLSLSVPSPSTSDRTLFSSLTMAAARSARLAQTMTKAQDTKSTPELLSDKKPQQKIKPIPKVPRPLFDKLMVTLAAAQEAVALASHQIPTIDAIFEQAQKNNKDRDVVDTPQIPPGAKAFFQKFDYADHFDATKAFTFYEMIVSSDAEHLDDFHLTITGARMSPDSYQDRRLNMINLDIWARTYVAEHILLGYLTDAGSEFYTFCEEHETTWDSDPSCYSWRDDDSE